ncbi:MAG: hypothetical protein GF408_04915 [Candidatus Omnitrophica bacterium]|nr:hypothetical protein [Candidatus Omnitrophota bacterium]
MSYRTSVIAAFLSVLLGALYPCRPVTAAESFLDDFFEQRDAGDPVGKVLLTPEIEKIFVYRPVRSWAGEKFIFHPKPVSLQRFYYPHITLSDKGKGGPGKAHPSYADCAGRICTLNEITSTGDKAYLAEAVMDDDGTKFTISMTENFMDGLIAVKDLENARKYFLNKKVWYLKENLLSYDPAADEYIPVWAEKGSRLKIVRIEPSFDNKAPIRIFLDNGFGQTGYIDINLSGTNVPATMMGRNTFFETFSLEDPSSWSEREKNLIANNMVASGMSRNQVRKSWGPPLTIQPGKGGESEKWVYPYGDVLIFRNGKMAERTKEK